MPTHPNDNILGQASFEGERRPDDDVNIAATKPTAPAALRVSDVDHEAGERTPRIGDVETADPLVDPEKVDGEGAAHLTQENPIPKSRAMRRAFAKTSGREASTLVGRLVDGLDSRATPSGSLSASRPRSDSAASPPESLIASRSTYK